LLVFCFFFSRGFWPSPPLVIFPLFNNIWDWRYRMGVHQGANLIGMSLLLLDVCPLSWFTYKKNIKELNQCLLTHLPVIKRIGGYTIWKSINRFTYLIRYTLYKNFPLTLMLPVASNILLIQLVLKNLNCPLDSTIKWIQCVIY